MAIIKDVPHWQNRCTYFQNETMLRNRLLHINFAERHFDEFFFKSLVHNWRKLSNIVVNRTILSRIKENQLSVNMFLSNRKLTIWLNIYNGFLCLLTLLVNGLTFSITEIKKYTRKLYSFVASLLNNLSFLNMKLLNYKMLLWNWKLAILNTLVSR